MTQQKTIPEAIRELQDKIEQRDRENKKDMGTVNTLSELIGQKPVYKIEDETDQRRAGNFLPDEFYGQPLAKSITMVMEAHGSALSADDIYGALIAGGYKFDSKSDAFAKRSMVISMSKNPKFHRLPSNDMWGLRSWYPNIKNKASSQDEAEAEDSGADESDDEPAADTSKSNNDNKKTEAKNAA